MAVGADVGASLAAKFAALFPHLDERQRRLAMGAEARVLGHGGVAVVARAAGVSRVTVSAGVAELEESGTNRGRLCGLVLPVGVGEAGVPASVVVGEGVVEDAGADLQ